MNRWAAVLTAAGVSAGALLMFPRVSGAPSDERHEPTPPVVEAGIDAPSTAADTVRVDHEFVVVRPAPVRAPELRARPAAAARPDGPAVRQPVRATEQAAAAPGLAARAGRLLVGDGRYRPSPFPRPDREK